MNSFSNDALSKLFEVDPGQPNKPRRREGSSLEYKESFTFNAIRSYARTFAAYSNANGGYMVFGISNSPRLFKGLKNNKFDEIDPAKITEFLNDAFSPEILWDQFVHTFRKKSFGIIYVNESVNKPIIARKNIGNEIKEGEIYYRYRGRTERIKYPEISAILAFHKGKERDRWVELIKKIASIGVSNTAIMDINTGEGQGQGGVFVIEEKILEKIQFIKDANLLTKEKPTVRIIGDAQVIDGNVFKIKERVYVSVPLHEYHLVDVFINQTEVENPLDYIQALAYENTWNIPIYYYIHLSKFPIKEIIDNLEKVPSRNNAKRKLIQRLKQNTNYYHPIYRTDSEASVRKFEIKNNLLNCKFEFTMEIKEIRYFLKRLSL